MLRLLLSGVEAPAMESQIRVAYEDSDWQMPVRFMKTEFEIVVADGDVSLEAADGFKLSTDGIEEQLNEAGNDEVLKHVQTEGKVEWLV